MAKPLKGVGGGDATNQIRPRGQDVRVHKKTTNKVQGHEGEPEVEKQQGVDFTDRVEGTSLPKSFGGSQQSPLSGLIQSGFNSLAKLYGLDGSQGALQLQLTALGGSEPPENAFSTESRKATVRQFRSLGFELDDAKKMVDMLAFVFAGSATTPQMKKSHRELKIQHEIDGFRKSLVDLQKTQLPERDQKLAATGEALLGKANQIGGRLFELAGKDMPKELELIENRVRAVFDIVKIVSRHFLLNPPS